MTSIKKFLEGGIYLLLESRVHAACCKSKGQPFYDWFVDGSNDRTQPV